jgi:DUF4097 and DUF4098 domain-containing protein YvlB
MRPRGDGFEVRVEVERGGRGMFRRNGDYRVRIAAPNGAGVRAQLASADISGRGSYGDVDVKLASGDVEFEQVDGQASVDTASGDVSIERVGSARINSASGDVEIEESAEGAEVSTASGDVQIGSVTAGEVRVNSASGDIEVGIAKGSRLWVDAQSLSGDTSSEIDLDAGTPGEGDEGPLVELRARSMSGDVSIKRA